MQTPSKLWFGAKTYGFGWHPQTWQGWLTTVLFVIACGVATLLLKTGVGMAGFLAVIFVLTAVFIAICYRKGEKPRWRWGKD